MKWFQKPKNGFSEEFSSFISIIIATNEKEGMRCHLLICSTKEYFKEKDL